MLMVHYDIEILMKLRIKIKIKIMDGPIHPDASYFPQKTLRRALYSSEGQSHC